MKNSRFVIKTIQLLIYCIYFLVVCAGASMARTPPSDESGLFLFPKKSTIWPSNSIPVCWENPTANFSNEMRWVQEAITNSWQKVSAVNFTGWDKCSNVSRGIRIQIDDKGPHTNGLGSDLDGKQNGMVLNFYFINWCPQCLPDRERSIRLLAIHEFGHALGFAHEQNRPDTPTSLRAQPGSDKQWCSEERQGTDGDILIGAWDLKSVMNYCSPQWVNGGQLSETDIDGIRKLYGKRQGKGTILYTVSFDGKKFGSTPQSQIVSNGQGWCGWSWIRSTASYIVANGKGETVLYLRPFDGRDFGPVSLSQTVSSGTGWRGWSWNGTNASYIAVNGKGETVLYVRPFDGKTFGPVSFSQTMSSGDGWRGWSWNGTNASYIAVDGKGETVLYVRPFDGKTFGPVSFTQTMSSGDGWRGWSWDGTTASYVVNQ